jgi:hypothetical protein
MVDIGTIFNTSTSKMFLSKQNTIHILYTLLNKNYINIFKKLYLCALQTNVTVCDLKLHFQSFLCMMFHIVDCNTVVPTLGIPYSSLMKQMNG